MRRALAACAALLVTAAPASATDPTDRLMPAVWTGDGTVSPAWPPIPTPGADPTVTIVGTVDPVKGSTGTCSASWQEDPSGVPWGVPFTLTTGLYCDGGVAHWSGGCIVTRFATIKLTCLPPDGAVVTADLAVVPSEAPFVSRFTFAGPIERSKPL